MYLKRGVTAAQTMTALHDLFSQTNAPEEGVSGLSRRQALRGLMASAAGVALASLPMGGNAEAGEAKAATITDELARAITAKRHEMQDYSENPTERGIGIFINLQSDATPEDGERLGERLKQAFASRGVPVEYRFNQSRGTATDLTFYVRGYDFTVGLPDVRSQLGNVLAHHRDVWPPGQASLSSLDQ